MGSWGGDCWLTYADASGVWPFKDTESKEFIYLTMTVEVVGSTRAAPSLQASPCDDASFDEYAKPAGHLDSDACSAKATRQGEAYFQAATRCLNYGAPNEECHPSCLVSVECRNPS